MHACATNGQLNRALGLVERMFKLDVKPDAATYNVLLQAHAQLWHTYGAIVREAPRNSLTPTLPLLQACDREGKPETLSELLVGMPQLGCEPTLVNYNTAIRGLARAGEQKQVRHVIDNVMVEAGVPPAISTFRAAINGSCAGGHTDDAVASLRTLQARGFFPDAQIQLMLLEATEATDADALPKLEAELNTTLVALRARRARQVQRARSYGSQDGGRGGRDGSHALRGGRRDGPRGKIYDAAPPPPSEALRNALEIGSPAGPTEGVAP